MNNHHLEQKLRAIQSILIAYLNSGQSNLAKGNEREFVINQFLSQILPPQFRFGQGEITDKYSNVSGHCDIVVELPFFLRLNVPSTSQSLYLAESVGAVIEVKSNLKTQWEEVMEKSKLVKKIYRPVTGRGDVPPYWQRPLNRVPFYVISFTGYKQYNYFEKKLNSCDPTTRPDGILIIDSGYFIGLKYNATGVWSLYVFVSEILLHLRTILSLNADPFEYCRDEIKPPKNNGHMSYEIG